MTKNRKYWKSYAKRSLKGHWMYAIGGCVIVQGINLLGNALASRLFPGTQTLSLVLSELFLFVFSIVAMIFSTGYDYMLLNMARGRETGFGDVVAMFRRGTDGVLTAGLVISLIQTLVQIPFYYMLYIADAGTTAEQQWIWMKTCLGFFVVGTLLSVLFTMPFAMTFCLLADNPQMSGMKALETSVHMMKDRFFKYLLLQLSFVPLLLLSIFTFYIGLLWLLPYIEMTTVVFYMDAMGEFENPQQRTENGEPQSTYKDSEYWESTPHGDDYNSEA